MPQPPLLSRRGISRPPSQHFIGVISMVLKLNEEVVFRKFDGDPSSPKVSCELAQGTSRFHCLVPQDVSELLRRFDGTRTLDEVVGAYCDDRPAASSRKLTQLIENYSYPTACWSAAKRRRQRRRQRTEAAASLTMCGSH